MMCVSLKPWTRGLISDTLNGFGILPARAKLTISSASALTVFVEIAMPAD